MNEVRNDITVEFTQEMLETLRSLENEYGLELEYYEEDEEESKS